MVAAVILAAGASKRLGRSKALLDFAGRPLIADLIARLLAAGDGSVGPIVVVVNQSISAEVGKLLSGGPAEVIVNPDPSSGRTGSLKIGLASLRESDAVLVVPVDRPGWTMTTLDSLLAADRCCCPAANGRGGHPLRLQPDDIERILAATDDEPLNRLVEPERFEVSDEFLHLNIDSTDDLSRLAQAAAALAGSDIGDA